LKNSGAHPVYRKELSTVAKEWDAVVDVRHRQILNGIDLSYDLVLKPTVLDLLKNCSLSKLIDVGCGSGDLSSALAGYCIELVGVDPSIHSIEVAESVCKNLPNTSFYATSIEEFAIKSMNPDFSIAVANMSLMNAPDLHEAVGGIAKVLKPDGTLIITISHPCFWPQYWGYDEAAWFRYDREIGIQAPFQISRSETPHLTTHFHRPLSTYTNALTGSGFVIEALIEPMPNEEAEARYPERWLYPRFLAFRCRMIRPSRLT
jgi:SAM-dependent methyltransferase